MQNFEAVIEMIETLKGSFAGPERGAVFVQRLQLMNQRSRRRLEWFTWVCFGITLCSYGLAFLLPSTQISTRLFSSGIAFGIGTLCILLVPMGLLFRKTFRFNPIRIEDRCWSCSYDLSNHQSVLGDDVWVGPEVCPECGERYPAIG